LAQDRRGRLNVVAMDVTDAKGVRNAATQLKDVAKDVLINSAGIAGASGQKTGNVDYESWAHVFNEARWQLLGYGSRNRPARPPVSTQLAGGAYLPFSRRPFFARNTVMLNPSAPGAALALAPVPRSRAR
jgi:hypothetical protein